MVELSAAFLDRGAAKWAPSFRSEQASCAALKDLTSATFAHLPVCRFNFGEFATFVATFTLSLLLPRRALARNVCSDLSQRTHARTHARR